MRGAHRAARRGAWNGATWESPLSSILLHERRDAARRRACAVCLIQIKAADLDSRRMSHVFEHHLRRRAAAALRPAGTTLHLVPDRAGLRAEFGVAQLRDQARRTNQELIPRPLSIYVHVPFCFSPCFYCGCNRIITRDTSRSAPYLSRLAREIEADRAVVRPRP
jgi:hypothetical protein